MPARDIALALFVALLWGGNFVVMKHAVSEVPPLALAGLRFALATVPAIFFVSRPAVSWQILAAFGVAFGIAKFGLLFTAFKLGMPAGLAALVLQLQAAITIGLAFIWLNERPTGAQWAGLALALCGVGLVMIGVSGGATLIPVAMTFAAACAWAVANIAIKRAGRIDMLAFAVWSGVLPAIAMLAASLVFEGPSAIPQSLQSMTPYGLGALLYLAFPVSLLSGAIWGNLLSRYPAAAVTPFALLVPPIGFLCGWFVYGEILSGSVAWGGGLILVGLALGVLGGRMRWTFGA